MEIIEIKEENFEEKVINSNNKVLVDFYAVWCGPCNMMKEVLDDVKDEIDDYTICEIDVDKCPNIARRYGVMSIPNLFIFDKGEVKKNELGFKTKDELKEFLEIK